MHAGPTRGSLEPSLLNQTSILQRWVYFITSTRKDEIHPVLRNRGLVYETSLEPSIEPMLRAWVLGYPAAGGITLTLS